MPNDNAEVNIVVIDDDVFYQVASRLLVGIIRHGHLKRPPENLLPICRQALERMATMTLNEFVNKLDEPLWKQLLIADKRPGMAITMRALHDIWVDLLQQTLDSDDWQIQKGQDLSRPSRGTAKNRHAEQKTTFTADGTKIPKPPTGTKPTSNTGPLPGPSPSKIPRSVGQIPTREVPSESTSESTRRASRKPRREPLPKVIPRPSLFGKRHPSPSTPCPGEKRSHSRDGWSSYDRRPLPSGTSTSKNRPPPPDPVVAGGGLRERERTPYGGPSTPGSHKIPERTASERERYKDRDHTRSRTVVDTPGQYMRRNQANEPQGTTIATRIAKNVSSGRSQGEAKEQFLRTSEMSKTELASSELQDRQRTPYSWTRGTSVGTEASQRVKPDSKAEVSGSSYRNEQAESQPVQTKNPGLRSLTPEARRHEVRPTSPFLRRRPGPREERPREGGTELDTESGGPTREAERGPFEALPKPRVEDVVEQIDSDWRSKEKPEQQYADRNLAAEYDEPEEAASTDNKHTDGLGPISHYSSSHVEEGQGEHRPSTFNSYTPRKREDRRSNRTSKSRREVHPRPVWIPRSPSHWIAYYHRPTSPHQDPWWDNSDLWAYFRSLLRVTDEEIYSSTGPENPYFQPLPAPELAPVGESGPIVPYHELPERLQPWPVAGKGFVAPTTPFRVGFVTSILDPKVLRQRCLGRRKDGDDGEGKAGFDEGRYAERSKICYPPPLEVGLQSDVSGDGQPEGEGHQWHGQGAGEPEIGVIGFEDGGLESEHTKHRRWRAAPEASHGSAGLSYAPLARTEVSEPGNATASTSVHDYARTRDDMTTSPALHEPMSPTADSASLHSVSDDEMAQAFSSEDHEPAWSNAVESQDGAAKAERAASDNSDCDSHGPESTDGERYHAENHVIDEYGNEDEDDVYRPEDHDDEEYEAELEEAEDD